MGLDSVEIVMAWEESLGVSISDREATILRTPRLAIDLIAQKLAATDEFRGACLALRAFHRLRHALVEAVPGVAPRLRPGADLRQLLPHQDRSHRWKEVRAASGLPSLPGLRWFSGTTVRDLTHWAVANAASNLKAPGERWTRSEIRSVVRAAVTDVMGAERFDDDDEFIKDIGVDG